MKKFIGSFLAMFLVGAMAAGLVGCSSQRGLNWSSWNAAGESGTDSAGYGVSSNGEKQTLQPAGVLRNDYLDVLSLSAESVVSLSVLTSTSGAPRNAVDLSEAGDGSVLGWTTKARGWAGNVGYDCYIAGEGGVAAPQNSNELFMNFLIAESLDVSGLDTSRVTDMSWMFFQCRSLASLDVSGFDTSRVTDMSYMFDACESLTSLDVRNFDTSQVTDMSSMFDECSLLTNLDLSGFDTSRVTNMEWMFGWCSSLESLDLSGFDTSQVTSMASMFYNCSSLNSLDLSGFDSYLIDEGYALSGCPADVIW